MVDCTITCACGSLRRPARPSQGPSKFAPSATRSTRKQTCRHRDALSASTSALAASNLWAKLTSAVSFGKRRFFAFSLRFTERKNPSLCHNLNTSVHYTGLVFAGRNLKSALCLGIAKAGRDPIYIKEAPIIKVPPHKTLWQPPGRGGCVLSGGAGTDLRFAGPRRRGQIHDYEYPDRLSGAYQWQCTGGGVD